MSSRFLLVVVLVALALASCSFGAQVLTPTPVPPTNQFPPAPTTIAPASTPAAAPKPANPSAPAAQPALTLGDVQTIDKGGFSFRPVNGYRTQVKNGSVGVFNPAGTVIITLDGVIGSKTTKSPQDIMNEFLDGAAAQSKAEFKQGTPFSATVDGAPALGVNLVGSLSGKPLRGQAVVVTVSQDQFMFAVGIANTGANPYLWESEGNPSFAALMSSVKFIRPSVQEVPCQVSTDPTYGYARGNPVKIGGGEHGGPARERAFLDNLRGPKGETLSYQRTGSGQVGGTIVDIYQIKGLNEPVELYIDEYNYVEPKAPAGFTCASAFVLK